MEFCNAIFLNFIFFIAVIFSICTVFVNDTLYSIIFAFITFAAVSLMFFALELPYLAVIQGFLYCILLIILLLFAKISMVKFDVQENLEKFYLKSVFKVISGILFIILAYIIIKYGFVLVKDFPVIENCIIPSSKELFINMFLNYGMIIVFSSLLFIITIIGLSILFNTKLKGKK